MPSLMDLEVAYLRNALGSAALPGDTIEDLRTKFYNNPPLVVGTGMPEGVVTAAVGTKYIDTAVTNGASEWIKKTGSGNTGWTVSVGDTGYRSLNAALANGWAAAAATTLRRTGDICTMQGRLNGSAATADILYTLPLGFQFKYGSFTLPALVGGSLLLRAVTYTVETAMRGPGMDFQISWATPDPWPIGALPGVAG